jgi:hypothetical protein
MDEQEDDERRGEPMSPSAVVMMVLICGFVWGGFTILLTRAIRREGDKQRVDRQPAG